MKVVIMCAVIAFALCVGMVNFARGDGTVIAVDPPLYNVTQNQIGMNFTLNINITGVTNLWSWGVRLNWNPDVVNVTNVQEGAFLKSAGSTLFLPPTRGTGYLKDIGSTLLSASSANGSGVLFIATFEALAIGQSNMTLNETSLIRYDSSVIPTTVNNGQVIVTVPEFSNLLVFVFIFAGVTVAVLIKKQSKVHAETLQMTRSN